MARRFDVAVLGDGPAGDNLARALGKAGQRVLMVEAAELGGECLNAGCIPSKALIHLARERGHVPWAEVQRELAKVTTEIRGSAADGGLPGDGVRLVRGTASFAGRELQIDGEAVAAKEVVIATGTAPTMPPIEGLTEAQPLTNRTLFKMRELPRRLAVIGGGPIGLELGQALAMLGTEVTIFESGAIAPTEDRDVAAALRRHLIASGLEVLESVSIGRVRRKDGVVTVSVGRGVRRFDELLVAAGRAAVIPAGAVETGLKLDVDGFIAASRCGKTSLPGVWAIGDAGGGPAFTHHASYQAHHLARHLIDGRCPGRPRELLVPWAIFTTPEVGHAGMTEEDARRVHGDVRVVTFAANRVDWFRVARQSEGFAKVICDSRTGRLLGAHFFCAQASTLAGEAALAIQMRLRVKDVANTIHPYPTCSELFRWACAALVE